MFTGLVQAVGRVAACEERGGELRLRIDPRRWPIADVALGESIAVAGVCLTVVACDGGSLAFDVSGETRSLTTLGALVAGSEVNLERAMLPTDRLGGHLVSGHVDGVGRVAAITPDARSQRWRFTTAPTLLRYVAVKGSICVDGVSLTVNAVDAEGFAVNLIPHTLAHTTFGGLQGGDRVNLEVDLLARYVERLAMAGGGVVN